MLDHADQNLGRLLGFLDEAALRENTLILVMSDNGASQEGGPLGMVNAMGPYNGVPESVADKIARIDDIGGPDTHANFPWGWAMAANTPLKRYKQNTHGGGIRDPLVACWPKGIAARGSLRHGFRHACDIVPTLLEVVGAEAPATIAGIAQQPLEGVSLRRQLRRRRPARAAGRSTSRCSATAGYGATAGRRFPTTRPAPRSKTMSGSSIIWTQISQRWTTSPRGARTSLPS